MLADLAKRSSPLTIHDDHCREVETGERFAFGRNWARFLRHVDESRILSAEESLKDWLGSGALAGKTFLDIGCGSGLFSLAARRLGARVTSFDYDPESVACTEYLRERFSPSDADWTVKLGSVLDRPFLNGLGRFDVVYAWGVLHHTGDQWTAMDNAMALTRPGGAVFLALYNDQGWLSRYWIAVKRLYNRVPWLRGPLVALYAPYFVGLRWLVRLLSGRRRQERGMTLWYDLIDWLGGWPFEVATPQQVVEFAAVRGFRPVRVATVGRRQGCNEFILRADVSQGGGLLGG